MRLLFTLFDANGLRKNRIVSLIDTNTGKNLFLEIFDDLNDNELYNGGGIAYSGDWLCIGVNSIYENNSYLLLFNFITGTTVLLNLPLSYNISDIISIYPGQLYLCSRGTQSLNNVSFSPITGDFWGDQIHYKHPPNFFSVCTHQMRWYGTTSDSVIELTNNRVVYSGLNNPNNLFFNSSGRICFLEENKFYRGDDIFYYDSELTSIFEDIVYAGYWVYFKNFGFKFINYSGEIYEEVPFLYSQVSTIVGVRGYLNETI
jgi:hypothetical protein